MARGGGAHLGHRQLRSRAEPALLGHRQSRTPIYYGDDRKGDNLYTASIVALDADTGKLKWHFQFTPHDTHDWDSNHVPVLADLTIGGQPRKVVMVANRNGFFYVLDRVTGKLLVGKPFSDTTWARELGPDGHPIVLNDGSKGCLPDQWGGTNYMPPSFDPALRAVLRDRRARPAPTYLPVKEEIVPGRISNSGTVRRDAEHSYGVLRAIDPTTVERQVGVQVSDADDGGRDVDGVGRGVRGRQRRQLHGLRRAHRQEPLVLSDRLADLGRGADDLHARRPAARGHRVGHHDDGLRAAEHRPRQPQVARPLSTWLCSTCS